MAGAAGVDCGARGISTAGCSVSCPVGCSVGCSVDCSVGCSLGCSEDCSVDSIGILPSFSGFTTASTTFVVVGVSVSTTITSPISSFAADGATTVSGKGAGPDVVKLLSPMASDAPAVDDEPGAGGMALSRTDSIASALSSRVDWNF